MQATTRQLTKPVVHKNPVTKDMLHKLHEHMNVASDQVSFLDLRDWVYILLSFFAFLRFDEASNVRRKDLHLYHDYFSSVPPAYAKHILMLFVLILSYYLYPNST